MSFGQRRSNRWNPLAASPAAVGGSVSLSAESGTFVLTGTAASLEHGYVIVGGSGTFVLTGTAASLEAGREVAAGIGAFTLTGTAANLEYGRLVAATSGTFVLTGQAANLNKGATLTAASGAFTLTGIAANLEHGYRLSASSGAFSLTGQAATLTYTPVEETAPTPTPIGGTMPGGRRRKRVSLRRTLRNLSRGYFDFVRVDDEDTREERRLAETRRQFAAQVAEAKVKAEQAQVSALQQKIEQARERARIASLKHYRSRPKACVVALAGGEATFRRGYVVKAEGCAVALTGGDISVIHRSVIENFRAFQAETEARQMKDKRNAEAMTLLLLAA